MDACPFCGPAHQWHGLQCQRTVTEVKPGWPYPRKVGPCSCPSSFVPDPIGAP